MTRSIFRAEARRTALALGAIGFAALLLGGSRSASAQDWRGPVAIEVVAEDSRGKDLPGAEVRLVYLDPAGGGGLLPSVLTDSAGKAAIGGLAAGRWMLEVRHAGQMTYRAEIAISADNRPAVLSAAQEMTPGAIGAMRVKLNRSKGGAPIPARVAAAPQPPPTPVPQRPAPAAPVTPTPAARTPAPAPAAAAAAKPPAPAVVSAPVVAPTPAPSNSAVPSRTAAPATAEVPQVAAGSQVPAAPKAPNPAPAPQIAPPVTPPPAISPQPKPADPAPPARPEPQVDAPAARTEAAPAPAVAPVATAPQAAVPAPAAAAPSRQRVCVECAPGESAAWGEASIDGGATSGCPGDLRSRFDAVSLYGETAFAALAAAVGPGCRTLRLDMPAGARFTGFRYEASGANVTADCLPGRDCPAGQARFPFEPVIRREGGRTTLLVAFESTAADWRSAVVAGYYSFTRK